jgi:amino acid adenylation domain-containing protein/FkbM family methyltransferase
VHHFKVPAAVADVARRLGERCGATLFMTLLTAFKVLIARYGGDPDVVVGMPVANRPRPELEPLIGFFVNTLPLYSRLDGNPTFVEALMRVRAVVLDAHDHQALPFERLVEVLQPERHLDRHPIFQISFVLQNAPQPVALDRSAAGAGPLAASFDGGTDTARFDLTLAATDTGGDLACAFEYSTDLFDASTIREMAVAYCGLLEAATQQPDSPIADLPFGDSRGSSVDALGPDVDFGTFRSVPALIEEQMRRTPDSVAVVFDSVSWTYHDLDIRSLALARALRAAGIGPESNVGVFARRSAHLVGALVGILRSGAAFVPLDAEYPAARIESMVRDAAVDVVLVDRALEASASGIAARQLILEDALEATGADPQHPASMLCDADADQSAYVLFTSGSTGRPKGCINTHGGLRNRLLWMQSYLDLRSDDVVLQKTPFTFDVSIWEFFLPLLAGARLVVAEPDGHKSAGYLADTIAAHGVTTVHFVPSMLQIFLGEPGLRRGGALRRVICSGEALTPALRDRCLAALDAQLFNLYGPTEASIDVTAHRFDRADRSSNVPIGLPIANAEVHILDEALRPVPSGVPGEIYLGGVPLARGYANQPDLTAERFVPHPLSSKVGRLYRTGDRARRTPSGVIEYLGRLDEQVKLGGVRIELGDIESHLLRHPGVERAAVAVRSVAGGADRLAAYVVPGHGPSLPVRRALEPLETTPFIRTPEEVELPNGMAVLHMNRGETSFLYREIFDERCYERFGTGLQHARSIVDVGAHIGLFSLYASLRAPDARIIAVEPLPDLARVLRHNLRRYDIDAQVIQAAAGSEEGSAELTYFPGAALISGRHDDPAQARLLVERFVANAPADDSGETSNELTHDALRDRLESVRVRCRVARLSDLLRSSGVTQVDFLKIDVEGSELDVLRGIDDEHWSGIGQLALEVRAEDSRLETIGELLRSRGFFVHTDRDPRLEGTNLVQVYASRAVDGDRMSRDRARQPAPRAAFAWCSGLALVDDLRSGLEKNVPTHMIPSEWWIVDDLPVTGSGKLDRRRLTSLNGQQVRRNAPYVAPRTDRERIVALVWAEVLRVERIGVDDNFFTLGGHSLLAARGAARLRDRLSIEVPVRAFFEHPTVAELAAALSQYPGTSSAPEHDTGDADDLVDVNLLSDTEVDRRLQQLIGSGGVA